MFLQTMKSDKQTDSQKQAGMTNSVQFQREHSSLTIYDQTSRILKSAILRINDDVVLGVNYA